MRSPLKRLLIAVTHAVPMLALAGTMTPASADWQRVAGVDPSQVFCVRVKEDTIVVGIRNAVQVSTDAGATWRRSAAIGTGSPLIVALSLDHGRWFAGTAGQGVFVSADRGATWQAFNQGLVGGLGDAQLDVGDLETRGGDLLVATLGAGVYLRNLDTADTWHPFGAEFEPNQASNVNDLARAGTRLVACAGSNGTAFIRDPGDADWTQTLLGNTRLLPGVIAHSSFFTGTRWVLGSSSGVFLSLDAHEPWTRSSLGPTGLVWSTFAQTSEGLFAQFNTLIGFSTGKSLDDGTTWTALDNTSGVVAYQLATHGNDLYAARSDGLWLHVNDVASVPGEGARAFRLAVVGRQPVGDRVQLAFDLSEAGRTSIEVFDVLGRRAEPRIEDSFAAGPHVVAVDMGGLAPGVYAARLTEGSRHEVIRLVHVR